MCLRYLETAKNGKAPLHKTETKKGKKARSHRERSAKGARRDSGVWWRKRNGNTRRRPAAASATATSNKKKKGQEERDEEEKKVREKEKEAEGLGKGRKVAPRMKKTRFVFTARAAGTCASRVWGSRLSLSLSRARARTRARAPSRSVPGCCGLCRGPVPAEGPVWDAMPRLVLTVASRRRGPLCSLPPAPLRRPALPPPLLSRDRRFPPVAPLGATSRPPHPAVFRTTRATATRVHAYACRIKQQARV